MVSHIRDINLWESGELKLSWVRSHMPLLDGIQQDFEKTLPFKGLKVALSVHLEAKTAHLCEVLAAGGADMYITGSNPLSTQDDVAAALVHQGLNVFAVHGCTEEEYFEDIRRVLSAGPNIIIDDGGDLVTTLHKEFPELLPHVIGGCEETTTGILRLKAMDAAGKLTFPMMLVNDADCKHLFDNRYGTGQSVWDGINRTTNLIVTEVDPVKALEAVMDGFKVMPMADAAPLGDFFVTVTGCEDVIGPEHFLRMRDGAICCNAGHFDVEVAVAKLKAMVVRHRPARNNIEAYQLSNGRSVYVIAEGRLVNLAAGDGHPAEIMDMSFAIQALSAQYLVEHKGQLAQKLNKVPVEIDRAVALRKLSHWGVSIDTLTEEQAKYIYG